MEVDDNWDVHDEAILDCEHDWQIKHVGENSETGSWIAKCINCSVTASPEVINDYMAESDIEAIKLYIEKDRWKKRQYSWRKWGRRRLYEIKALKAKLAQRDARIAFLEELYSKLDSRCEELWDHILEKEEGNG